MTTIILVSQIIGFISFGITLITLLGMDTPISGSSGFSCLFKGCTAILYQP